MAFDTLDLTRRADGAWDQLSYGFGNYQSQQNLTGYTVCKREHHHISMSTLWRMFFLQVS